MDNALLFLWMEKNRHRLYVVATPVLALMICGIYWLVEATGGIKFVYSHAMYIPILLSGFLLGVRGGVITGLIAGLVLGPFMPIDTLTGEMQNPQNWLFRTVIFSLIGLLSGMGSDAAMAYQQQLKWIARHQLSTGLPNRQALVEYLTHLHVPAQDNKVFVLVMICFENSQELKSTFGYDIINHAVLQMVRRLQTGRQEAKLYHIDTTQIALVMQVPADSVDKVLNELTEQTKEPVSFNGFSIHIDTRIGYVSFAQVQQNAENYFQMAEAALTVAYDKSLDCVAYSPVINIVTEENLALLGELKDAIKNGQLYMRYQPKVNLRTGEIYGVEALMRWNHPKYGNISPNDFIPRAEQSTLIHLITQFALEQSIQQMEAWRRQGIAISMAVNISTHNLLKTDFTAFILKLLNKYDLSGEVLELELTEGSLMMDVERTIDELRQLAALKIVISLDDFGAGYSSLQYLHQLPISLIKIDQSFVRRLPDDQGAAYILDAAIMLSHNLGIKTIAEGVESQQVLQFLSGIGCDMVQGFHICMPLTADDFSQWYKSHQGNYPLNLHSA